MVSVLFGGKRALMTIFNTVSARALSSTFPGSQKFCILQRFNSIPSVWRWCSNDSKVLAPPKRPLTAYMYFVIEQHSVLHKQNPGSTAAEVMKLVALAWRELSPEQKQGYEVASVASKLKYKEEMDKYQAQISPVQLAALKEERKQRSEKRRGMQKRRELTQLGKPKRSRSPFNIFVSEHFVEAKGINSQAKLKALFEDWHNLDDAQKQLYIQLAQDDKIRYENEMKPWEEQMIEIGRDDLVRKKRQIRLRKGRQVKGSISVIRTISTKGQRPTKAILSDKSTPSESVTSAATVNEE